MRKVDLAALAPRGPTLAITRAGTPAERRRLPCRASTAQRAAGGVTLSMLLLHLALDPLLELPLDAARAPCAAPQPQLQGQAADCHCRRLALVRSTCNGKRPVKDTSGGGLMAPLQSSLNAGLVGTAKAPRTMEKISACTRRSWPCQHDVACAQAQAQARPDARGRERAE